MLLPLAKERKLSISKLVRRTTTAPQRRNALTAIVKICVRPIRVPNKNRIAKPKTMPTPAHARKRRAAKVKNASTANANPARSAQNAAATVKKFWEQAGLAFAPRG